MKKERLLNLIMLLLCTITTLVANAYDFEVDGIYYNRTSSNTVEVTYNTIGSTYEGTVVIPNTVAYNGVNYTVTAIGDSAFYHSCFEDVTIPETVTLIGKGAFIQVYEPEGGGLKLTCLSTTPPEMEGAFDVIEDSGDEAFPFPLFDEWYYPYFECLGPILFVSSEAYQGYKEINETHHYFSWIFGYDWEKTAVPSTKLDYLYSLEREYGVNVSFTPNEESKIYCDAYYAIRYEWYDFGSVSQVDDTTVLSLVCPYDYRPVFVFIRGIAVAEGKLPSDPLNIYLGDNITGDYYGLWPPYHCDFDFEEAGIFYVDDFPNWSFPDNAELGSCSIGNGIVVGDKVYVSNGTYYDPCEFDWNECFQPTYTNCYFGNIIIPTKVRGYNVIGIIDEYPRIDFSCSTSLSFPFDDNFNLANCTSLKRLILPATSRLDFYSYEDDDTSHINLESLYLFGEGNQGYYFYANPSVDTLYLGRGVTGVHPLPGDIIYSYATTPPTFYEDEYGNLDTDFSAELHVPTSSLAAYFTAPYWSNFTNIIGDINPITGFSLAQDSVEILKGSQYTIQTVVTPAHTDPGYILWQSTNKDVATVNNGVVTAVGYGECEIQAICQGEFVVCRVFVTEIPVTEVTLDQDYAKMEVGGQLTLTATVLPEDATDKTVTWSSSNTLVATVNDGVVTAVGPSDCYIRATCNGKQATCHIHVVEHFIYITLDQHEADLLPNHILTLTPTVTPVPTDLKVTSSNPAVAAARLAGDKIQVVGISEGEATIVVQSTDGEAEPDSCYVSVYTLLGDVDCDGYVSISDVTALIDILLGVDNPSYSLENADCDLDDEVTINDVTVLADALLENTPLPDKNERVFTVNGVTFKMRKVKGGTFTMGATEEADSDHQTFIASPEHQVTLSNYCIGQTEVTQELWQAVMGSNPSYGTTNPQYPVNNVCWLDCDTFIMKLNALTGRQFRLPTEAEWEFAAHGGTKSKGYVYAGSDDLDEIAWILTNSDNTCHPVATKKANELGLYDMNGNIEEWCNDWYSLYTEDPVVNPTGPETGLSRMHRGGRWSGGEKYCRLSRRDGFHAGVVRNYMGLRLAL